ncbi:Glutathione-dependent formaldehyde-activating enzyme [Pseudomonas sp. AD21]|nr:Glutathione-dependent formaldehyde-activating enzyme [Pseudomonas sp. AD21]
MNTPRYAKGSGQPPVHLASINSTDSMTGHLLFAGVAAGERKITFTSHAELVRLLNELMLARVPFAAGGMCPGPADEASVLIADAELAGPYLELSWTGPQQWVVRQITDTCGQWQLAPDISEIANTSFDPDSLKSASQTLRGSCLCRAVKYQINSKPKAVTHCHCSQCRKSHGAAFASYGSVLRKDLELLRGTDDIKSYPSSEAVLRQFCTHCGASLFWSRSQGEFSDWISIALGTLDTAFIPDKQQHVEVTSKASWYEIQDHWPHRER